MKKETREIIEFYERLSPESLANLSIFYHEKCFFKDPFHEFHSREKLQGIYKKMFKKLEKPSFLITNYFEKEGELVLFWDFRFNEGFNISGSSLLVFDENKKIVTHIDYWDSVSEIWMKIPIIRIFIKMFYKIF